ALTASALSVIDGDTLEARVAVFPGQEIVTRIRLAGVDAPERRGRCASERDAAEKATRALGAMVEGRRLTLTKIRGDKYFGRVVARVSTQQGDLAEALVAGGYGRPYGGGRRDGWC
ncbi:MAG: thermonuclease family protein, partial [Hansschlegelia sp.]